MAGSLIWEAPPMPPDHDEDEPYRGPRRSYGRLIAAVIAIVVLVGVAAAGYWKRDAVMSVAHQAIGVVTAWRSTTPAPSARRPAACSLSGVARPRRCIMWTSAHFCQRR